MNTQQPVRRRLPAARPAEWSAEALGLIVGVGVLAVAVWTMELAGWEGRSLARLSFVGLVLGPTAVVTGIFVVVRLLRHGPRPDYTPRHANEVDGAQQQRHAFRPDEAPIDSILVALTRDDESGPTTRSPP